MRSAQISLAILVTVLATVRAKAETITVCWDGSGDFTTIQEGINGAIDGDDVVLCTGTYTGDGNRDLDFGGRAITVRGSKPGDSVVVAATIIDCQASASDRHRGFVFQSGEGANSVLAGITIRNGYAPVFDNDSRGGGIYCRNGSSPTIDRCVITNCKAILGGNSLAGFGGGMFNDGSSPTVTSCSFSGNSSHYAGGGMANNNSNPLVYNCKFIGNTRALDGAGMYNYNASSPTVLDCTFRKNSGSWGAGMYNFHGTTPTVANCTFSGNTALNGGGGMFNNRANATVTNCAFKENRSAKGGGMRNAQASPTMINCTFSENTASDLGGGMYNDGDTPSLLNCTLRENSASNAGGGMYNAGGSNPNVTNCLLWDNGDAGGMDQSAQVDGAAPNINYSCVQGWTGSWSGIGNTGDDPLSCTCRIALPPSSNIVPNECEPGSCCADDGMCSITLETDCGVGTWTSGRTCEPNLCPQPLCNADGVCDAGEDCDTCPQDCDSKKNGHPSGRYCCGNVIAEGPEGDGRCDGNP